MSEEGLTPEQRRAEALGGKYTWLTRRCNHSQGKYFANVIDETKPYPASHEEGVRTGFCFPSYADTPEAALAASIDKVLERQLADSKKGRH